MKKIYKHVYKVVVLSEEQEPESYDLSVIHYNITEGFDIGQCSHESTELVKEEDLEKELIKIGNDGTFFEEV